MLELEPLKETKEVTDPDSGAKFWIKPLSADKHNALRNSSKKNGEVDVIEFSAKAAKALIHAWEGVGKNVAEGECQAHDVAKMQFGRRYAYSKMGWLIQEAMEFDQEITAEKEEAKNA